MTSHAGIVGWGCSLPETVRTNDDPVFDWLRHHQTANEDLFTGFGTRRVLAPVEDIATHMADACTQALGAAGIHIDAVDGITGALSNSPFISPNGLADVHRRLGLRTDAWVRPVTDEFTNFLTGLLLASALVDGGRATSVLVTTGCNWTQCVDYHTAPAIAAGDGAAAAVVASTDDPSVWRVADEAWTMKTDGYGDMTLAARPVAPDGLPPHHAEAAIFTAPMFGMAPEAHADFTEFGGHAPPALVAALLAANGLQSGDVALAPYQASAVLLDAWEQAIAPARTLASLAELGNMTLASVPVNLARGIDDVTEDHLVAVAMNTSLGVGAMLLTRG